MSHMTRNSIFMVIILVVYCSWPIPPSAAAMRQGGEDETDPFEIWSLPFTDFGTTVGYDPDVFGQGYWCPIPVYGPDVWYSFTPSYDMFVNIDLCGTEFDNYLIVLDQDFNQIDCFDDGWSDQFWLNEAPCGAHTARLPHVPLQAEITYFIIVGGPGQPGPYEFYMHEDLVIPVECPPDAIDEGEPPIVEGYFDVYNSGCTGMSPDNPIQLIDLPEQDGIQICGNSGWFWDVNSDTDWYGIELGMMGKIEATLESERSTYLMHLSPPDCDEYEIEQWCLAGYGDTPSLVVSGLPGEIVWIVVTPRAKRSEFWPDLAEYQYLLTINPGGGIATERTSWGSVKALYR